MGSTKRNRARGRSDEPAVAPATAGTWPPRPAATGLMAGTNERSSFGNRPAYERFLNTLDFGSTGISAVEPELIGSACTAACACAAGMAIPG